MNTLWETLVEFAGTLGTLAKAQSVLAPLVASWVFTGMWVYATERKRHGRSRPGRAWFGLFWLPGLLVYYLFPGSDAASASAKQSSTFTFRRMPETLEAPRPVRHHVTTDATSDGVSARPARARGWDADQKTDDGTARMPAPARARPPVPPAVPAFSLAVLNGNMKGKSMQAPAGLAEIGVGSRANNHIRLDDPTIAPWHVIIKYEKTGDWTLRVVEHAAHKYRTQVNGRPATVIPLRHRDEIQLGDVRLRFNMPVM